MSNDSTIKFSLSYEQEVKLNVWKTKIQDVFGHYGHYDYVFTPYGMGTGIKVISHLSKTEIDLTEEEKF